MSESSFDKIEDDEECEDNNMEIEEDDQIIDFTKSMKTQLVHFLPCKIDHDNYAPVKTFFEPTIRKDNDINDYYTSNFRGKLYRGKKIEQKIQICNVDKQKDNELYISSVEKVDNFFVWEFDKYLDKNDNLVTIKEIISDLDILK